MKIKAGGEALRIRQWKQIGDQIRSTRRTATSEFLFLRIISTLVHAATEAAAFGFLEDMEPPTRKRPKSLQDLFLRTEPTSEEKGIARGVQEAC